MNTTIYSLSLHDALPILLASTVFVAPVSAREVGTEAGHGVTNLGKISSHAVMVQGRSAIDTGTPSGTQSHHGGTIHRTAASAYHLLAHCPACHEGDPRWLACSPRSSSVCFSAPPPPGSSGLPHSRYLTSAICSLRSRRPRPRPTRS